MPNSIYAWFSTYAGAYAQLWMTTGSLRLLTS
jgi:hypothetical protein